MISEDERECIRNKPWFSIDVECVAVGDIRTLCVRREETTAVHRAL